MKHKSYDQSRLFKGYLTLCPLEVFGAIGLALASPISRYILCGVMLLNAFAALCRSVDRRYI